MADYIIYAALAALGIAIGGSLIGCFVVWRRMAYFGEAIAHSSILGIFLGLYFSINLNLSIIVSSLVFCLLLLFLERRNLFPIDSSLGVLAHGLLAIGILLISLHKSLRFNIEAYLFGDVLTVSVFDITLIYLVLVVILVFIFFCWQKMLLFTLSQDLARVDGINVARLNFIFILLVAMLIAVSIRSVGLVLVISMIIIPATCAKLISFSARSMLIFSAMISLISVLLGLFLSIQFDLPTGPAMVALSFIILVLLLLINLSINHFRVSSRR